eukprot:SAG25_NODE_272_length_10613_cov_6.416191_18_plen_211_part_00
MRKTAVIEAPCSPSTGDCQRFGPHGASITSRLWQGAAALHAPRHPAAGDGHGGRGGGLGVRAVGRAAARQQQVCPRQHFMIRAEDEMNRRVGESQSLVLFLSRNIGQVLGAAHPARQDPPAALPRGESKRPVVASPWPQCASECQQAWHPPGLIKPPLLAACRRRTRPGPMECRGACRAITGREARRPLRCVTVISALNGQKGVGRGVLL